MPNVQEVLAKPLLDENDINFLVANIDMLTEEDKIRLGFVVVADTPSVPAPLEIKPEVFENGLAGEVAEITTEPVKPKRKTIKK